MKNLLSHSSNENVFCANEEKVLCKQDILAFFYESCKKQGELKIGMEYERLPLDTNSYKRKTYYESKGIQDFLTEFCELYRWDKITENNFIIGATKNNVNISLEPGAQLEISTSPKSTIFEIEKEIIDTDKLILPLCAKYNMTLSSIGVAPHNTWKDIPLIPKKRYHLMANILSGKKAHTMMRETAGIQATFDFTSENDAISKLKIALMLSPFSTAMFANSPFYNGAVSEYFSYRASAWLDTDEKRCGFINAKLFEKNYSFGFEDYIDSVLNVPMLYFVRGEKYIQPSCHLTFKTFLNKGYNGYYPTMDDFLLHLNLFFPEVRLRNYIEIRNNDSLSGKLKYAPIALYKAILYNSTCRNDVLEMLKDFTYSDFVYLRQNVPKQALKTSCRKGIVQDYAKEILSLAQSTLSNASDVDEIYLEEISEFVSKGKTPADYLIKDKKKLLL